MTSPISAPITAKPPGPDIATPAIIRGTPTIAPNPVVLAVVPKV